MEPRGDVFRSKIIVKRMLILSLISDISNQPIRKDLDYYALGFQLAWAITALPIQLAISGDFYLNYKLIMLVKRTFP